MACGPVTGPSVMYALIDSANDFRRTTDKMRSTISVGVSAKLRIGSSKAVLEEVAISWGSPEGTCALSDMA